LERKDHSKTLFAFGSSLVTSWISAASLDVGRIATQNNYAGAIFTHLSYVTFQFICFSIAHWIVETAQSDSARKNRGFQSTFDIFHPNLDRIHSI
jgi:hypothetical protein